MGALLESARRHDGQVYGTAEIDEIGVGGILDLRFSLLGLLFIVGTRDIRVIVVVFVVAPFGFSQNLSLEFLVSLFVSLPIRIKLENVQTILNLKLVVQSRIVGDLILLLYQIQLVLDCRVVFVLVLSDLEQDLNHVLDSLVDISLVEDAAELIKDGQGDL